MPEKEKPIESVMIDYVLYMINDCSTATLMQRMLCLRDILATCEETAYRSTRESIVRAVCRIPEVPDDF